MNRINTMIGREKASDMKPSGVLSRCRLTVLIAVAVWACTIPAPLPAGDYRTVTGPCGLRFPDDHGMHPGYRTEWWYYTGNVADSEGRAFGYQLTFFRTRIRPPSAPGTATTEPSPWRTDQIFLAHAAVTDIRNDRHLQAEDLNRGVLEMAGVQRRNRRHRVFVNQWEAVIGARAHRLSAATGHFSFDLTLEPLKPPVLHGKEGYSQKGSAPENASCYYSLTRMQTRGRLIVDGVRHMVSGLSWMDHEYSTAPLEKGIAGWDWFSLQLDNDEEIMVFLLRRADTGAISRVSGTRVLPDARAVPLDARMLTVKVEDRWRSDATDAAYPSRWRLDIPGAGYTLDVSSNVADQEMRTQNTTGVIYWEGSVSARGTQDGKPVSGVGYVELTGYASAFDAPL